MSICRLCHGMGNLFNVQVSKFEWFTCPGCLGNGARNAIGSGTILIHTPINVESQQIFSLKDFQPNENLMAHVMAKAGFFKSVSEAKKNGWNKPLEAGVFKVGKQKKLEITE